MRVISRSIHWRHGQTQYIHRPIVFYRSIVHLHLFAKLSIRIENKLPLWIFDRFDNSPLGWAITNRENRKCRRENSTKKIRWAQVVLTAPTVWETWKTIRGPSEIDESGLARGRCSTFLVPKVIRVCLQTEEQRLGWNINTLSSKERLYRTKI